MIGTTFLLLAMSVSALDDAAPSDAIPTSLVPHIGYGFSAYNHRPDATSSGVIADLEYAYQVFDWLSPRAYVGTLITFPDRKSCGAEQSPCDVSNTIGFVGAKARLLAPFSYIAPYAELGAGVSFGHIKTLVIDKDSKDKSGFFGHISIGAGLALGKKHGVDLGLMYLLHPSQEQVGGGIAVGLDIPL